ncbi:MAG: site-specific DNA-methyltransferase [Dehalococcoidia bacterium]|nr:site-specific DNA-methyltransferase [Dehalococcoidia bacterium]
MAEVEDGSVQLVVTSPPYNVGKAYESPVENGRHLENQDEYMAFLQGVWQECVRTLCVGGRLAVNVASTWRQPYVPLHSLITMQLQELGLVMRGEIIWDKGASAGVSTAWGSFARASNPTLRDVHEYILVFSKESLRLESKVKCSGISNQDFVNWTRSIWRFPTESARRAKHPAPFPEELPRRLILLYTNRGDLILDPFMGCGTTAVAAVSEGRHYVGYDTDSAYCLAARQRLVGLQPALLEIEPKPETLSRPTRSKQGRLGIARIP